MNLSSEIKRRIKKYKPKGGLDHASTLLLSMASVHHASTRDHMERVALMSESVARTTKKDCKAAFFAGLLHDAGKMLLPHDLFDGHDITDEEYQRVKGHAVAGFEALRKQHLFTALCAGLHHNLCSLGYGVGVSCFPRKWSPGTVKKVLEISVIVSVCDFVDAWRNRKTKPKGVDVGPSLIVALYKRYPDDVAVVDAACGRPA